MPALYLRLIDTVAWDDDGVRLNAQWSIVNDDGSFRGDGETDARGLADLIDADAEWIKNPDNVVVIVPSEYLLSVRCEVPGRAAGQIRRALPFVVEEHLASDVERMHIANGPIQRGEPVECVVIERGLLKSWLDALKQLGLNPGYLVGDAQLLPVEAGSIALLFDGETVLLRNAKQAASVDQDNVLLALGAMQSDFPEGDSLTLWQIGGQLDGQALTELEVIVQTERDDFEGSALSYLVQRCRSGALETAVNLLQGGFVPVREYDPIVRKWRSVATLAGFALALGVVTMTAKGWWAEYRADSLQAETTVLYKDIFPDATRFNNIRQDLAARLGQRVAVDSGFLKLVYEVAGALGDGVVMRSVNYTENRGEMTTEIVLQNFDQLESVKDNLQDKGVNAEVASAEQVEGGVRARLRIKDV